MPISLMLIKVVGCSGDTYSSVTECLSGLCTCLGSILITEGEKGCRFCLFIDFHKAGEDDRSFWTLTQGTVAKSWGDISLQV